MKYVKLFESKWTESKVRSFVKEKNEICDLVFKFLIEDKFEPQLDIKSVISFDFYTLPQYGKTFIIEITEGDNEINDSLMLLEKDYKRLFDYIEHPDIYKEVNNYNL